MKKLFMFIIFSTLAFAYSEEFGRQIPITLENIYINNNEVYKSIVLGNDKGELIYSFNEDEIRPLASLTKLMTASLIIDDVRSGKFSLNDKVVASKAASSVKYGYVVKRGRSYTVKQLLELVLINSSNSAAYLLAEYANKGSVDLFVQRMNNKAKKLGLETLSFSTPNGLPPIDTNKGLDVGSAKDVYGLALHILTYPEILEITNKEFLVIDKKRVNTTNSLLGVYPEVKGLKTGFHSKAKYNIVYYIEDNDGDKLLEVILGSKSANIRTRLGVETIKVLKGEAE